MSKKKTSGGGSDLTFCDPEAGDCCEYQCPKKDGRYHVSDACGSPAVIIVSTIRREANEYGGKLSGRSDIKVCKRHLTKMITELVTMLELL